MVTDATEALKRSERDLAEVIAQRREVEAVTAELAAVAEPFLAALKGDADDADQD